VDRFGSKRLLAKKVEVRKKVAKKKKEHSGEKEGSQRGVNLSGLRIGREVKEGPGENAEKKKCGENNLSGVRESWI